MEWKKQQVEKRILFRKNLNFSNLHQGYCFNGICPSLNAQCAKIWGYGGSAAEKQCYEQFNSKGSMNGHCGMDQAGHYIKCEPEYVNQKATSEVEKTFNIYLGMFNADHYSAKKAITSPL